MKEKKKQELLRKLSDSVRITRRNSSPTKVTKKINSLPKRKSSPLIYSHVNDNGTRIATETEFPEENVMYEDPLELPSVDTSFLWINGIISTSNDENLVLDSASTLQNSVNDTIFLLFAIETLIFV